VASSDLLLHPVRLRIVKTFLGDRSLTTAELADELSDVPVCSLYRHVALLTKAGVLEVVAERRVRGAVERTYGLRPAAARMQPDEVAAMSPDEHAQAFVAFVAGLLDDFDRYVESDQFDPVRDRAAYRVAAMWLSDAEYSGFLRDLVAIARPRLANAPRKGRRRRTFYQVLLPAPEATGPERTATTAPGRSGRSRS
jgi:DNA-binding transcriptional ArsR family regulator